MKDVSSAVTDNARSVRTWKVSGGHMNHWVGSSEDEDHSRATRLLGKNSGEFELKVMKLNESALSFMHFLSFGEVFFFKHKIHHSTHD